jgi:uridine kinase
MVVRHIKQRLREKSDKHKEELEKLRLLAARDRLSDNVFLMDMTPQVRGMNTILQDPATEQTEFIFYFDRLGALLIEK